MISIPKRLVQQPSILPKERILTIFNVDFQFLIKTHPIICQFRFDSTDILPNTRHRLISVLKSGSSEVSISVGDGVNRRCQASPVGHIALSLVCFFDAENGWRLDREDGPKVSLDDGALEASERRLDYGLHNDGALFLRVLILGFDVELAFGMLQT
ncbi:hypothetical protein M8C21_005228 [Ambrosia artemisiifolia]|uniref:Uncharacterized protein n=1 Tax=Ambrosia artemisiifolia TaxID=4212 RepID=A0AAD5CED5_AMBAR|nr:hypothetical protein M8C21_005228 [Ambrosia artemisiifolia]